MDQNLVEAERWLAQSEQDAKNAEWDLKGKFYEHVCFLMQQAAEKALKAVLVCAGKRSLPSHSTLALAREAITIDSSLSKILEACKTLDRYYIPTRYPDAFPSGIPNDFFGEEEAHNP